MYVKSFLCIFAGLLFSLCSPNKFALQAFAQSRGMFPSEISPLLIQKSTSPQKISSVWEFYFPLGIHGIRENFQKGKPSSDQKWHKFRRKRWVDVKTVPFNLIERQMNRSAQWKAEGSSSLSFTWNFWPYHEVRYAKWTETDRLSPHWCRVWGVPYCYCCAGMTRKLLAPYLKLLSGQLKPINTFLNWTSQCPAQCLAHRWSPMKLPSFHPYFHIPFFTSQTQPLDASGLLAVCGMGAWREPLGDTENIMKACSWTRRQNSPFKLGIYENENRVLVGWLKFWLLFLAGSKAVYLKVKIVISSESWKL